MWVVITIIIFIAIIFVFNNKLFKLFISLECKYNKLQFGLRISSTAEVSKQKPVAIHNYQYLYKSNHLIARKSILLKCEGIQSDCRY